MLRKGGYIVIILVGWATWLKAQILDDTTRLVYGPETTKYRYLNEIKLNIDTVHYADSTLDQVHMASMVDLLENKVADLGNLGTPLNPIFYNTPDIIGARSGYHGFDAFTPGVNNIKFFDTKSPYINVYVYFGAIGRSLVDFDFSRNINPRWNIGFNFRRITADKQIGATQNRGDRNVVGTYWDYYTNYKSKNKRYELAFYGSRQNQEITETGGVDTTNVPPNIFLYQDSEINLQEAEGSDFRLNYHLYHQYKLVELFTIYHEFHRTRQVNQFNNPLVQDREFFDQFLISTDTTADHATFKMMSNELGVKGYARGFFYNFYVKRRDAWQKYRFYDPFDVRGENYGGFVLRYDLKKKFTLGGDGELLQQGGLFKLNAYINSPWIEGGYHTSRYQPSFLEQAFFGNHYEWNNDFDPTVAVKLYGKLKVVRPRWHLKPGLSFTTIDNFIHFGTDRQPQQFTQNANLTTISADAYVNFFRKKLNFRVDAYYTNVSGESAEAFRIPEFMANGKLWYSDYWFNDYMEVQLGFDMNYRTEYLGDAYDPITQQFYLQDPENPSRLPLKSYFRADFFFNFKVNTTLIFLKVTQLSQPAPDEGYYVTPLYPGQQRVFDIGVRWLWFD